MLFVLVSCGKDNVSESSQENTQPVPSSSENIQEAPVVTTGSYSENNNITDVTANKLV